MPTNSLLSNISVSWFIRTLLKTIDDLFTAEEDLLDSAINDEDALMMKKLLLIMDLPEDKRPLEYQSIKQLLLSPDHPTVLVKAA